MKPLSYINELESAASYSSVLGLSCLESAVQSEICWLEPPWDQGRGRAVLHSLTPQCSQAHLSHAQLVLQLRRFVGYDHNWKCRFDTDLVFHTCCRRKNPAPYFHVPVFISSFPFFGPNPLCSIAVGQSEPGSALKHWQLHGFKHTPSAWCSSSHTNLITSHWNQLPKKHQILLMLTFSNTRVPASKTEHNSFQYSKKPCK